MPDVIEAQVAWLGVSPEEVESGLNRTNALAD